MSCLLAGRELVNMMKTAYVFPGQGAQFPGMAKGLYDSDPDARRMLERADEILGFRITDVMFGGSEDDLRRTDVTQPAVFLHSAVLAFSAISHGAPVPDMVAGHSLGEFSALCVAGALEFEDALLLVSRRAAAMQKCCLGTPGAMAAVIGCDIAALEDACARVSASPSGTVVCANYNNHSQVVISGTADSVAAVCEAVRPLGKIKTLPLPVGGAFHSPLMEPAREELAAAIGSAVFHPAKCPVYQNVTAEPSTDPDVLRRNLLSQLTSPVRWTASVERMIADGASSFMEIGPGKALRGMVSKIAGVVGAQVDVNGMDSLSIDNSTK